MLRINCLLLIIMLLVDKGNAQNDSKSIMVKVFCTSQDYNYYEPWKKNPPKKATGSGFIIKNNRIITNAHVVTNAEFVQVRKEGNIENIKAKVEYISHENDLAILTIEDANFFKNIEPLEFENNVQIEDEVSVMGFPQGGDKLSITKGIISRIENITYSHSNKNLLAVQIDAAINPGNSGGPVIKEKKIIGIAFQGGKGENIGYIIPSIVISQFLKDIEDKVVNGIPTLGIKTQELESSSHRELLNLTVKNKGVLVVEIFQGSPLKNNVLVNDVILEIDGNLVSYDGNINLENYNQVSFTTLIQKKQIGEFVRLKCLRNSEIVELNCELTSNKVRIKSVSDINYETPPNFYIYGGLIFEALTLNYLKSWGENWKITAPHDLVNLYLNEKATSEIEEIVILISVLADDCNIGYHNWSNRVIQKVNGKEVTSLKNLVENIERNKNEFQLIEDKNNFKVVLNTKDANQSQQEILNKYGISFGKTIQK